MEPNQNGQISAVAETPQSSQTQPQPSLSDQLSQNLASQTTETVAENGGGSQQASSTQSQPQAVSTQQPTTAFTVRDFLKEQGYDPSSFQDDKSATQAILAAVQQHQEQLRQLQGLAELGQKVLPHLSDFERWRASQGVQGQQTTQSPQAQPKKWYEPPQYDPQWLTQVTLDDKGNRVPVDGRSWETVQKLNAYLDHRTKFLEGFVQDPIGSIKGGLEEVIQAQVQDYVTKHFSQYQSQQFADQVVAQDKEWLFNHDARGQRLGLSPAGERFKHYVQDLDSQGVKDVRKQYELARKMVQADLLAAVQAQQQQNQSLNQQSNQKVVQQNQVRQPAPMGNGINMLPQTSGSFPSHVNGNSQNESLNLIERLRQSMQENGITDQHFIHQQA